jgi:hypothetical protein
MPLTDAVLHDRAQALRHAHAEALLALDAKLAQPTGDAGGMAALLVAGDPEALALLVPGDALSTALAPDPVPDAARGEK